MVKVINNLRKNECFKKKVGEVWPESLKIDYIYIIIK